MTSRQKEAQKKKDPAVAAGVKKLAHWVRNEIGDHPQLEEAAANIINKVVAEVTRGDK